MPLSGVDTFTSTFLQGFERRRWLVFLVAGMRRCMGVLASLLRDSEVAFDDDMTRSSFLARICACVPISEDLAMPTFMGSKCRKHNEN